MKESLLQRKYMITIYKKICIIIQQSAIICNLKNVLYKVQFLYGYILSIYHNNETLLLCLLQIESLFSKLYIFLSHSFQSNT